MSGQQLARFIEQAACSSWFGPQARDFVHAAITSVDQRPPGYMFGLSYSSRGLCFPPRRLARSRPEKVRDIAKLSPCDKLAGPRSRTVAPTAGIGYREKS